MAFNIFDKVRQTVSNLKTKAQTGIQNWAQNNPQQATRIINAPQQIAQTYQKVAPYVPFVPRANPQAVNRGIQNWQQAGQTFYNQAYRPVVNFTKQELTKPSPNILQFAKKGTAPIANAMLSTYGLAKAPVQAAIGGLIGTGFNRLSKNKVSTGQAFGGGAQFVSLLEGMSPAVKAVNPLISNLIKKQGAVGNVGRGVAQEFLKGAGYGAVTGQNPLKTGIEFAPYGVMGAGNKGKFEGPLVKGAVNDKGKFLFNVTKDGKTVRTYTYDTLEMAKAQFKKIRGALNEGEFVNEHPFLNTSPKGYKMGLVEDKQPPVEGGVGGGGVPPGNIPPKVDPVQKLIQALNPLRQKQESLYTKERGARIGEFTKTGEKVTGEKGFYTQLGKMKGELPKVQFETLRQTLDQPTIDSLFDKVKTTPILTEWEKVTAGNALAKMFGKEGTSLPTKNELSLLSDVFGEEFTKAILDKRPLIDKVMGTLGDVLSIPRSLLAGGLDMSFGLRQGIFGAYKHPKQWASAFKEQFKYFVSEKAVNDLNENIIKRPNYQLMRGNGLSIMNLGNTLSKREEQFRSSLAEKIPIIGKFVRASGRAYTGFANKFRADVFDEMVKVGQKTGDIDDPRYLKDAAKFINAMTGRGSLGPLEKVGTETASVLFSPRLLASRIQLLNPLYYARLQPQVRKEALKTLFAYVAGTTTLLELGKLGGFEVSTDPTNADFLKIKKGNTRLDIMGGFQQPIVLAARLLTGELTSSTTGKTYKLGEGYRPITRYDMINQFFENKTAPVASFLLGLMKGANPITGEQFEPGKEFVKRIIPMFIQDMIDLYKDDPSSVPLGIPAFFGAGVNTYKAETPSAKAILLDKELVTLPQEEANKRVLELKNSDPDTYEKLKDVVKERKLGLTRDDSILKQMLVDRRAEEVHKRIMKLPTSEERNALLQEYIKKGIVTDAVKKKLKLLIQQGQ